MNFWIEDLSSLPVYYEKQGVVRNAWIWAKKVSSKDIKSNIIAILS